MHKPLKSRDGNCIKEGKKGREKGIKKSRASEVFDSEASTAPSS